MLCYLHLFPLSLWAARVSSLNPTFSPCIIYISGARTVYSCSFLLLKYLVSTHTIFLLLHIYPLQLLAHTGRFLSSIPCLLLGFEYLPIATYVLVVVLPISLLCFSVSPSSLVIAPILLFVHPYLFPTPTDLFYSLTLHKP